MALPRPGLSPERLTAVKPIKVAPQSKRGYGQFSPKARRKAAAFPLVGLGASLARSLAGKRGNHAYRRLATASDDQPMRVRDAQKHGEEVAPRWDASVPGGTN